MHARHAALLSTSWWLEEASASRERTAIDVCMSLKEDSREQSGLNGTDANRSQPRTVGMGARSALRRMRRFHPKMRQHLTCILNHVSLLSWASTDPQHRASLSTPPSMTLSDAREEARKLLAVCSCPCRLRTHADRPLQSHRTLKGVLLSNVPPDNYHGNTCLQLRSQ